MGLTKNGEQVSVEDRFVALDGARLLRGLLRLGGDGGAPLLGIDGICIICHGSSGEKAIKNALGIAAKYARAGLNQLIVQELDAAPKG